MTPSNKWYRAFGLNICSDFLIAQVPEVAPGTADVRILRRMDLMEAYPPEQQPHCAPGVISFWAGEDAYVRVTEGRLIEVQPLEGYDEDLLSVYLMGSGLGAVLHQRGFLLLHGSCITDGTRSVLLTGDSGAGKSTLAAEFLKRGWKLITDDVSAVFGVEDVPMVQPSYPSQKLWEDSMAHYERPEEDVHSLYAIDGKQKYGVDVTRFFHGGAAPLSLMVRLIPVSGECCICPIEGMAKVDQLMRNTYRIYMIEAANQPRQFQRCVTLAGKLPMTLVLRQRDRQCGGELYDLITDYLGGINHGA